MTYEQLIAKVLNGRSVNATAKEIGIPQQTLDRYCKGTRIPDYAHARKLARATGIKEEVIFKICADVQEARDSGTLLEKLSANFKALMSHVSPHWSLFSAR